MLNARLSFVGVENLCLQNFPKLLRDRMRDVAVLGFGVVHGDFFLALGRKPSPALIAKFAPNLIFKAASRARQFQFSGRHCDEQSTGPMNHLDVPDDKRVVKGHRGVRLEFLILAFFQEDPNFRDLHRCCPPLTMLLP